MDLMVTHLTITPIQQDTSGKETNVYVVHVETGIIHLG